VSIGVRNFRRSLRDISRLPTIDLPMTYTLPHSRIPLSVPGSLLGISSETRVDPQQFHVRTLHRFSDPRDLFAIGLLNADADESTTASKGEPSLTPARLTLESPDGRVEIAFADTETLRFRTRAAVLRLVQTAGVCELTAIDGRLHLHLIDLDLRFVCHAIKGTLSFGHGGPATHPDRVWLRIVPDRVTGVGELLLQELSSDSADEEDAVGSKIENFDQIVARRGAEFESVRARFAATVPGADAAALTEAAYILWSFVAGPRGCLRRPAVLMSKNWMTGIWSWDNCFNARALASVDPELAWHQFMYFFDHQLPSGRAPDLITERYAQWGITKPPVYGWTLSHLRRHAYFNNPKLLAEAYEPMARQTRFWFERRDRDHDALPEYADGCDSGWDNGTCFHDCLPATSPDLQAWLMLQLEELMDIAPRIGRASDVDHWGALGRDLRRSLDAHCWDGKRWHALHSPTRRFAPHGDCLLPHLVGLAGRFLSQDQRDAVTSALGDQSRFLTEFGIATESIRSPLYESDGYWRGPIWGPSTFVAAEAAAHCGRRDLAVTIAERFVGLASRSGFPENYDALTGAPLRDPAYSWTASAWMILQQDWLAADPR
jgi:putative isomerase